jgi:ketosteroid isomerase-like protein
VPEQDHQLQVMQRFFAAIEAGDFDTVAELYDDDVRVWHSVTGEEQDKRANLGLLRWLRGAATFRYEVQEQVVAAGDGPDETVVARRHIAHFGFDGQPVLSLPAALFITLAGGKVTRIAEYVDSALTQKLLSSMPGTSH